MLTDCVPSKTLIATAELMTDVAGANELGVMIGEDGVRVDLARVNQRVKALAQAQSEDIARRLEKEGVQVLQGRGSLAGPDRSSSSRRGRRRSSSADAVLVATGAAPRTLPTAQPDGERILTWEQVYDLAEVPTELIVVGSGVTGAEFASPATSPWASRSPWSRAATGCCPARTPTRPPCSRRCSPAAG